MLIAVLGALLAFAQAAEPAGSAGAPAVAQSVPAAKPKMIEVCERVKDPGGRVPKRVCHKVEQKKEEAEEKAPPAPAAAS